MQFVNYLPSYVWVYIFTFFGFSIESTIIFAWGFLTLFLSYGILPLFHCLPFSGSIFETARHYSFFCEDPFRATLRKQFQTFSMTCLVDTLWNHRLLLFYHLLALFPKTLGWQLLPKRFPFWNTAPFSPKNVVILYCCYRIDPVHWSASVHFQQHLIQRAAFFCEKTNHENQDKDFTMSVVLIPVVKSYWFLVLWICKTGQKSFYSTFLRIKLLPFLSISLF